MGLAASLARRIRTRELRPIPNLHGQTVLITGGSRGFGLALAREFGLAGCRIAICARDGEELERARARLESESLNAHIVRCDVTDRAAVRDLIHQVTSDYGQIDILVANAGEIAVAPVEDVNVADFERAMNVMFWGALYPTFELLPQMLKRGSGRIGIISSIGGKVSVPHLLPYCCAKFAAVALGEGLRAELARHGILVTTIAPGLMRTGSYLQARFKGRASLESAWFSASATFPGIAMDAEQAAHQAFAAIRDGEPEKILSAKADLLARMNGLFPGLIPNVLGLVSRFLPPGTGDPEQNAHTVGEMGLDQEPWFQKLTAFGHAATSQWNETGG